jgi:alkanesulfonate monooxygenase
VHQAIGFYSTVPHHEVGAADDTAGAIIDFARRAENSGMAGLLTFYNHRNLDPWVVAGLLLAHTQSIRPLVALQPYSIPPFTAAKMISSLAQIYDRRIDLNLITGASPDELDQVGDTLNHQQRYERAAEYIDILKGLLTSDDERTCAGYYDFRRLRAHARVDAALVPDVFVAGSSDDSLYLARRVADVVVTHPEPVELFRETFANRRDLGARIGVRVGIIARDTDEEAWQFAQREFPVDRAAVIKQVMKQDSLSDWSRRLARLGNREQRQDDVYWTGMLDSEKASAPVLVGSYERVAEYLGAYIACGVTAFILARVVTDTDFYTVERVLDVLRRSAPVAT